MKKDMLVGLCFVSHTNDGAREYQGQILEVLENGFYLVQLYSWMTGCQTIMKIFSLHKLGNAYLYKNMDELLEHMEASDK
jgi:hypothetical protein